MVTIAYQASLIAFAVGLAAWTIIDLWKEKNR